MSEIHHISKRPFNKDAYDEADGDAKTVVIEIMKNLGYVVHGDPNEENYKRYDLNFYNPTTHKFLAIENETRRDFDLIRDVWNTVHIPIRKKNSQMDCYFVWKRDFKEVIVIDRSTFLKYRTTPVNVDCDSEIIEGKRTAYTEEFIDVPKNECKFYYLTKGFVLNDRVVNRLLSGFLNYP